MRSTKNLVQLSLILLAPALVASSEAQETAPRATVDQPVFDAGQVPVGEEIEAVWEIRNEGTAPLEITQVNPDCGCTVAEYDESIGPGGTGKIRATVDTIDIVGPNKKTITVHTNDPGASHLRLTVESTVKPFLGLDPGYVRFRSFVQHDRPQTSAQLLMAPDFEDLEIVAVETPHPWIDAEYRPAKDHERSDEASGKQWRIDVTLTADAPVGPVAEHVVVRTNHPEQEAIAIPVSGFVRPMIAVTPPDVNFGKVDPNQERRWGILVRNFGSAPLRIDGVRTDVAGIEVAVEPIEEGQRYKIVFTPTNEMDEGPFNGTVEVRTNLPQHARITVDVTGERI